MEKYDLLMSSSHVTSLKQKKKKKLHGNFTQRTLILTFNNSQLYMKGNRTSLGSESRIT